MMINRGKINKNGGFGINKEKGLRPNKKLIYRKESKIMQLTQPKRSARLLAKTLTINSTKRWGTKQNQTFAVFVYN